MPRLTQSCLPSTDSDSVQMLQRSTQVGEFYRMAPPKSFGTKSVTTPAKDGNPAKTEMKPDLPGQYMDIVIYDEEMDRHMHITAAEALRAAMHGLGSMSGADQGAPNNTGLNFFGDATYITRKYKDVGIDAGALDAKDSLTTNKTTEQIIDLIGKGEWHPVEVIIARPFIEHLMMSAVIAVAGRDTGATLFGPADMQISANTSVKTIEGHVSTTPFRPLRDVCLLLLPAHIPHCWSPLRSTLATPSPSSPSRRTSWSSATSCAPATWRAATPASLASR